MKLVLAGVVAILLNPWGLWSHASVGVGLTAEGQAVVAGTVTDLVDQRTPVRRATVTLSQIDVSLLRSAVTDNDGRFRIVGVPQGRFKLTAVKPGYLRGEFGATRFGAAGTLLDVAEGAVLSSVDFGMARGGALAGVVRDNRGEPIRNVRVTAQRNPALAQTTPIGNVSFTDDRGYYRIFGLPPGSYVLVARLPSVLIGTDGAPVAPDVDRVFSALRSSQRDIAIASLPGHRTVTFAPVFFPGVLDAAQTQAVDLSLGEVKSGLDITMVLSGTARIEGSVVPVQERPGRLLVSLIKLEPVLNAVGPLSVTSVPSTGNQTFSIGGIAPGRYALEASWRFADSREGPSGFGIGALWARADIDVNGVDLLGVQLALQPTPTVGGRVILDPLGSTAPLSAIGMRIVLTPLPESRSGLQALPSVFVGQSADYRYLARPDASGSFTFSGIVPGRYLVEVESAPTGWIPKSVTIAGRDALDYGLEIKVGPAGPQDLLVTMARRSASIRGALASAPLPVSSYHIVVFPSEPELRHASSRRVKVARPDSRGNYSVNDLPAGVYLMAALTDLVADDLDQPDFFERLADKAIKLILVDGEQKRQDFTIPRF